MSELARTFIFLGTGTSVGVPMLGCDCAVCRSTDPRNSRYRCSVLLQTPRGNILIDTPPEIRLQLLREQVRAIQTVLYTHAHVDHLFGLDDVRPYCKVLGGPMPIWCTEEVEVAIRQTFFYAFEAETAHLPAGLLPRMTFARIDDRPFEILGQRVVPIPLIHGRVNVLGFRIGDMAYCTDVNQIPPTSWPLLEGVRILVLDALRPTPHPTHLSVEQALAVIARLQPERAYLTHTSHELDYAETNRMLPPGVELAYDGLRFEF